MPALGLQACTLLLLNTPGPPPHSTLPFSAAAAPPRLPPLPVCRAKQGADMIKKAVLLSGPPGIGKTSSAVIVCRELGFEPIEVRACLLCASAHTCVAGEVVCVLEQEACGGLGVACLQVRLTARSGA